MAIGIALLLGFRLGINFYHLTNPPTLLNSGEDGIFLFPRG